MRRLRCFFILFVVAQLTTLCHCGDINNVDQSEDTKPISAPTTVQAAEPTIPAAQPAIPAAQPMVPSAQPALAEPITQQPGRVDAGEPPKPTSSVVLNFANNLGYDWYPLKSDNKFCDDVGNLTGCKGGLGCLVNGLSDPLLSAGNTLTDSTGKNDFLKVLKLDPASEALNALQSHLKALVMGSDIYRYGASLANRFANSITDDIKMLACNLNSTNQEPVPFKASMVIQPKGSNPCGIRVIGFVSADKMEHLRPENINVMNEVDGITSTIASEPRGKNLIVVMGEGTPELGEKISAIDDVDLVVMSGSNVTTVPGEVFKKVTQNGQVKYILTKSLIGLAQVTIPLLEDCRIADEPKVDEILAEKLDSTSEKCKIVENSTVENAIKTGFSKYKMYEEELSIKLVTAVSAEGCSQSECTLGSIAADAVARAVAAAAENPLDSRAVLLPAGIFQNSASLTAPVSRQTLMDLLIDDEVFYNMNLTAEHLKAVLEAMLNETGVNFPQLSGFRLFVDSEGDDGQKVETLHILRNHLVFENVPFVENTNEYRVILPLNLLLRSGIENKDLYPYNVTGVFLSEALFAFFQSESSGGIFLPPPLGERITYVLPPTQRRCENLIAITVCYTFLAVITISSVLLLGYKIYSDGTSVHYVR